MGSFTIYCAGCAGPFTRPSLGSLSRKALARRRRRVQRKLEAGYYDGEDEEDDEEDDEEEGEEDDEEEEDEDEDWSYDPEILTEDHLNWLEYLVCLGFDRR